MIRIASFCACLLKTETVTSCMLFKRQLPFILILWTTFAHVTVVAKLPEQYSLLKLHDIKLLSSSESVNRATRSTFMGSKRPSLNYKLPQHTNTKHISFEALDQQFLLALWPKDITRDHPDISIDVVFDSSSNVSRRSLDELSSAFFTGVDLNQPESSSVSLYVDQSGLITGSVWYSASQKNVYIEPTWRHESELGGEHFESLVVYYESGLDAERNKFEEFSSQSQRAYWPPSEDDDHIRETRSADYFTDISDVRCPLLLVADFKFFRKMGNSNWETTASYLIGLIDRINQIYLSTDFSFQDDPFLGSASIRGVGFEIKRIIIHKEPTNDKSHYNSDNNWSVQDLLAAFSKVREPTDKADLIGSVFFSHGYYCLCHLFTYEDLDDGVMGMAYRAEANLDHGVCAGSHTVMDFDESVSYPHLPEPTRRTSISCRNTGITTMFNWGSAILTQAADLVTGHELGHNFGSNHDPPECVPSANQGGSYIMYARAVSGMQRNNRLFSPCSRDNMGKILVRRVRKCFVQVQNSGTATESGVGICGNSKVDPGEQCDEGRRLLRDNFELLSDESTPGGDHQSSPSNVSTSALFGRCCNDYCQLIGEAQCSDMNHACCSGCRFQSSEHVCHQAHPLSCSLSSKCSASSGQCPLGDNKLDGTECLNHGVCNNGQCESYCHWIGQEPCECWEEDSVDESESPWLISDFTSTYSSEVNRRQRQTGTSGGGDGPSLQCVLCCQETSSLLNGSLVGKCKPVMDRVDRDLFYFVYPDHTMCTGGDCHNGQCISNMHNDILNYVFSAFSGRNVWQKLYHLFVQNVVFSIVFISLLLYTPVCLLLHFCIDKPILTLNKKATDNYIGRRILQERPRQDPPKSPSPISELEAPIVGLFHRYPSMSQSSVDVWHYPMEVTYEEQEQESVL